MDNNTIFNGIVVNEEQKFVSASYKTYTKIHDAYYVDPNTGKVLRPLQIVSGTWISDENIFATFSEAKDELTKRKSDTIVENVQCFLRIFKLYICPKRNSLALCHF